MAAPARGRRKNVLRKVLIEINGEIKSEVEDFLVNDVQLNIAMLSKIAQEGNLIIEERWTPAGLVFHRVKGIDVPVFPNKDPEELVLIEKVIKKIGPSETALCYLINRVMGRPLEDPGDVTDISNRIITFEMGDKEKIENVESIKKESMLPIKVNESNNSI